MVSVVVDAIDGDLILFTTFRRHVAAGVAVARKFGEATAAHLNAETMTGQKDVRGTPQIDGNGDNLIGLQQCWLRK